MIKKFDNFSRFLQMSGMTFGSIIEADRRLRIHGAWQRQQKKVQRDAEVWRRYEEDYELQGKSSSSSAAAQQAAARVEGGDGKGA
jgi:hypothetical protein